MIFSQIRKATVGTFIAATVLFVFLAVLSIWELVSRDFLEKSLVSLGVLSFGAVLIIIATLERDNLLVNPLKRKSTEKNLNIFRIIAFLIVAWLVLNFLSMLFRMSL